MHIRTLTKKSPGSASTATSVILVVLEVISAALGIAAQINSLVVNVSDKNAGS